MEPCNKQSRGQLQQDSPSPPFDVSQPTDSVNLKAKASVKMNGGIQILQ